MFYYHKIRFDSGQLDIFRIDLFIFDYFLFYIMYVFMYIFDVGDKENCFIRCLTEKSVIKNVSLTSPVWEWENKDDNINISEVQDMKHHYKGTFLLILKKEILN